MISWPPSAGAFSILSVADREQPHGVRRLAIPIEDNGFVGAIEFGGRIAVRLVESDEHPPLVWVVEGDFAVLQVRGQDFADHVVEPLQIGFRWDVDDADCVVILQHRLVAVSVKKRDAQGSFAKRKISEARLDETRGVDVKDLP